MNSASKSVTGGSWIYSTKKSSISSSAVLFRPLIQKVHMWFSQSLIIQRKKSLEMHSITITIPSITEPSPPFMRSSMNIHNVQLSTRKGIQAIIPKKTSSYPTHKSLYPTHKSLSSKSKSLPQNSYLNLSGPKLRLANWSSLCSAFIRMAKLKSPQSSVSWWSIWYTTPNGVSAK